MARKCSAGLSDSGTFPEGDAGKRESISGGFLFFCFWISKQIGAQQLEVHQASGWDSYTSPFGN